MAEAGKTKRVTPELNPEEYCLPNREVVGKEERSILEPTSSYDRQTEASEIGVHMVEGLLKDTKEFGFL